MIHASNVVAVSFNGGALLHCATAAPLLSIYDVQPLTVTCPLADTIERLYPHQWTELSPGSFNYNYQLLSAMQRRIYLSIGATIIGQQSISGIGPAPTMFDTLRPPTRLMVGQPLSLQLNSSATTFAGLAGSSTGWRVMLVRPDSSMVDLGLMADWEAWPGVLSKWNMTVPGSNFHLVSQQLDWGYVAWV
jgi:hypothetical protein